MALPDALHPLRHPVFRMLWTANLVSNIGGWAQSAAAGWVMTSLSPSPLMVSLVQVAALLPVFLLALPAGAVADLMDRRRFLILAQAWICVMALLLFGLAATGALGAWGLLAITFGIGIGTAVNFPAWAAVTPSIVPRADLPQAIVLNGMGFNLARSVGPAIGGLLIGWFGAWAAFLFNAVTFFWLIAALLLWRGEERRSSGAPPEGLRGAIRVGVRYVMASPAMRGVVVRGTIAFFSAASLWGLLPLLVRVRLGLGPEGFGLMLGALGAGAVAGGFALPALRARLSPSDLVVACSVVSGVSVVLLGLSTHWLPALVCLLAYGATWLGVASTLQAAAQMAARPWVRARAIGLYQTATFGGLASGAALGGVMGEAVGIPLALALFGTGGALLALAARRMPIEAPAAAPATPGALEPEPRPPAPELLPLLQRGGEQRVLESVRYRVPAGRRAAFLAAMAEVQGVRLRSGAVAWRLYEDVAEPELHVEFWAVESWDEHLREAGRLSEADHAALARAAAFHAGGAGRPEASRYLHLPLEPG